MAGGYEFEDWRGAMERTVGRCRALGWAEEEARETCVRAMLLTYAAASGEVAVPLDRYITFIGLLFDEVWAGANKQPLRPRVAPRPRPHRPGRRPGK